MEKTPDWAKLWQELVDAHSRGRRAAGHPDEKVIWRTKARDLDRDIGRAWAKPDALRAFVLAQLDPQATVLDIGAGTGAWAVLMARSAAHVTALEPAEPMLEILRARLAEEAVANVSVLEGYWPDLAVEAHDFTLCSHATYGVRDLASFLRRMTQVTRKTCFCVLRAPRLDGILSEAAREVWGHPFDSPNFLVAYNLLLEIGILPNVLMGPEGQWESRSHASREDALRELKWRLDLVNDDRYDPFLTGLLVRRLRNQDGRYVWPDVVRSALVYWPGMA